jgi:diguanylate cyclase (GGDEF)-like protein
VPGSLSVRFAVVGVATSVAYLWLPHFWQSCVYDATGFAAACAILFGLHRYRPARPGPWVLIALGILLWVVGDVLYAVYGLSGGEVPFPSYADLLYISGYVVIVGAIAMVLRRRGAKDSIAWLDAGIVSLVGVMLTWEWMLEPTLVASDMTALARIVAVLAPAADVLLFLFVLRLVRGQQSAAPRALAAVLACFLITDTIYSGQLAAGTYVNGGLLDLGWLFAYLGLGAIGLHPRMTELTEPVPRPARPGTRRGLLGLGVASILAPALLAVLELKGNAQRADVLMLTATGGALCVLTMLRAMGLLHALQCTTVEVLRRDGDLHRQATSDALTGLANRRTLNERIGRDLENGGMFSVALLDLDQFKNVNDLRGHEAGDALLLAVAEELTAGMPTDDLIARLGGDEFAVVSAAPPELLAERLRSGLPRSVLLSRQHIPLRASIGVAASLPGLTASDLLRNADIAMYSAKRAGGDAALVHVPAMSTELIDRLAVTNRLEAGADVADFVAFLQPVVDLATHRLVGFEALARWSQPGGGTPLLPSAWMRAAEETGLIVDIDLRVLELAASQLVAWSATIPGASTLHLAVNASGRSLRELDVAARVLAVLRDVGLAPSRVVLEVTESVMIDEAVASRLQQLREAGVRIALDDFGTGWSSLAYLLRFPIDMLKIDRSFVSAINGGPGAEAVPAAVLQLADALGLGVVAEGVETPEQAAILRRLGCRLAQGYLFGRPMAPAALAPLVRAGRVPGGASVVVIPNSAA